MPKSAAQVRVENEKIQGSKAWMKRQIREAKRELDARIALAESVAFDWHVSLAEAARY